MGFQEEWQVGFQEALGLLEPKLQEVQRGMIALQQTAFTSVLVRNDVVESLLI